MNVLSECPGSGAGLSRVNVVVLVDRGCICSLFAVVARRLGSVCSRLDAARCCAEGEG
jgi:hypothetical protein